MVYIVFSFQMNTSLYQLQRKKPDYIFCRFCKSEKLVYSKQINRGPKQTAYHYIVQCRSCNKHYHVQRNKYIYEQVKTKKWILSKNAKNLTYDLSGKSTV